MAADQQRFTVNKATPDWWKATKAFAYSSPLLSENLVEFFEKQEKTVSKRIRMIQDDLTSINMSVKFDVEPEVAEWIRRLDIMD